jgi:hypothetical protein
MSKYLLASLDDMFYKLVEGPDDAFVPPTWLLKAVQEVASTTVSAHKAPPIKFYTDEHSLSENAELLEKFDFDIAKLLDHLADTTIGYGSAFRPVEQLNKIFGRHQNFEFSRTR